MREILLTKIKLKKKIKMYVRDLSKNLVTTINKRMDGALINKKKLKKSVILELNLHWLI